MRTKGKEKEKALPKNKMFLSLNGRLPVPTSEVLEVSLFATLSALEGVYGMATGYNAKASTGISSSPDKSSRRGFLMSSIFDLLAFDKDTIIN